MHLIIHAGPPKTGTTALQGAFWKAEPALAARGVHFHRPPAPAEWALMLLYSHLQDSLYPVLREKFSTVAEARAWSERCWAAFEDEVDRHRPPVTLISSEHFANIADPEGFVARLRRRFDRIDLFAYARDPADLWVSTIGEAIRGGARFADLPGPYRFGYDSVANLLRFAPILGQGHVHLRHFARENLAEGDLIADAFAVLSRLSGRDLPPPDTAPALGNVALCGAATAWLLSANETFVYTSADASDRQAIWRRNALIRRLRDSPALAHLPRLELAHAPRIEAVIRHRARPTVARLNDLFLAGQVPLDPGAEAADLLPPAEARRRMRNWLFSYLTPRATGVLLREVVPLNQPEG